MAKKEKKIEIISEETTVVSEKSNNEKNIELSNDKLNNLSMHDLYYIEKVINVVCKCFSSQIYLFICFAPTFVPTFSDSSDR